MLLARYAERDRFRARGDQDVTPLDMLTFDVETVRAGEACPTVIRVDAVFGIARRR